MGLGDFLKGAGSAVANVAKGVDYVADPTHWDDIGRGVGKAAEYAVENPGKTWDTAFEVGRAVVKDQLDPMNLAINAGLIGLTVATGGAAAPAFLAKLGMGAKSVEAGVSAVKAGETLAEVGKGVKAATAAAEGAGAAMDVAKGAKTAAQVSETVGEIGKGVQTAGEAVGTASETGQALSRTQQFATGMKQIGTGVRESGGLAKMENIANAPREAIATGREALGMSRYGKLNELRAGQAEKVLGQAGSEAGGLRKAAARTIAGKSNPLSPAGAQTTVSRSLSLAGRGKAAAQAPKSIEKGVEVAANPQAAVQEAAMARVDAMAGQGSGYTDLGQTSASLYQPQAAGGAGGTTGAAAGQQGSQVGSNFRPVVAAGAATPPGQPPSTMATATPAAGDGSELKEPKMPKQKGGWKPTQHVWEGSGREALGGISPGHDWRKMGPLRKIETPSGGQAQAYRTYKGKMADYAGRKAEFDAAQAGPADTQGDLNEQGAPQRFAPVATPRGAYMSDQRAGGQPGSTLATMDQRSYRLNTREPGETPFGAVGPVKAADQVIDVDSYSPQDYGFGAGGQGQFAFPELGQPNTSTSVSPMYRNQSRTSSRKAIGTGTLGV